MRKRTKGSFSQIPAKLVRAAFAVVCLDTGNGANAGDWPAWWNHEGTAEAMQENAERLRAQIEWHATREG